jgi:VanZ family protein
MREAARRAHGPVYQVRGRSSAPVWLWLASALFVVYGTTLPFDFETSLARERLAKMVLNPLLAPGGARRLSIPDAVQNMLLFAPFGAFGVLTLRRRVSATSSVVATTLLGLALAVLVETAQLFTRDRAAATSDLLTNTLGALGGGVAVLSLVAAVPGALEPLRLRGLLDGPVFYPLVIAAGVLVVSAWHPFAFTLDVSAVVSKVRLLLSDPWRVSMTGDEGVGFVVHALFALAAGLYVRQHGARRPAMVAVLAGSVLALVLEGAQLLVESRMPGLEDVAIHIAGVAAGASVATRFPARWPPRRWLVVLFLATAVAGTLEAVTPPASPALHSGVPVYSRASLESISHMVELVLVYFPLGFCAGLATRQPSRWGAAVILAVLPILVLVEGVEIAVRSSFGGADIGVGMLGALIGAWLGAPGRLAFERWREAQAHTIEIV